MNEITPRLFIAATRQNDGKTTSSLGLMAALQRHYKRVGYIKPVGQRFVQVAENKIDEDTVLMDEVYRLNCPLPDMSPIAVEPDFTRRYLDGRNYDRLVKRIQAAFDRVAWEKDFVLCEGSGHAGVGSVFDLSNARVAKIIGAKAVIVSMGGIGRPIDEVALNQALFEKEGVEIIGVIINKVLPEKIDYIREFTEKGLKRRGLSLLGVLPHESILTRPSMRSILDELTCEVVNRNDQLDNLVGDVVLGAMSVGNAMSYFRSGVLMITPGDREDIITAAAASLRGGCGNLCGMILTRCEAPENHLRTVVDSLPYPVLCSPSDSYKVASKVHDLIVKTRPADKQKISVIRDMISRHVDLDAILKAL